MLRLAAFNEHDEVRLTIAALAASVNPSGGSLIPGFRQTSYMNWRHCRESCGTRPSTDGRNHSVDARPNPERSFRRVSGESALRPKRTPNALDGFF